MAYMDFVLNDTYLDCILLRKLGAGFDASHKDFVLGFGKTVIEGILHMGAGNFADKDYIQVEGKAADMGYIDKAGHMVTDYRVIGCRVTDYKDYSFESCFVVAETSRAFV